MQRLPNPWHVLPPRRCLLMALALALAWEPAAARATCGDHVRLGGKAAATRPGDRRGEAPAPRPCEGPHCSRNDSEPLVPPGPAPRLASSQDLHPGPSAGSPTTPGALDRPRESRWVALPAPPSSIFHPPR
jgi:hypothetical protein